MEQLMTSEDVAELLHVDPVTIRRLVNKGDLAAYRIGADYRFAPADLQDYLRRQRIPAHAEGGASMEPTRPIDQFIQWMRRVLQGKDAPTLHILFNRFDNFTDQARTVLNAAQDEAGRLHHHYIGTEHILLGLLAAGQNLATDVLHSQGIELQRIQESITLRVGTINSSDTDAQKSPGLTRRAQKVIELAADEARRLNQQTIGAEHLFLGLIREGEGLAAGVLESMGVRLGQARTEIMHKLQQKPAESVQNFPQNPQDIVTEPEEPASDKEG